MMLLCCEIMCLFHYSPLFISHFLPLTFFCRAARSPLFSFLFSPFPALLPHSRHFDACSRLERPERFSVSFKVRPKKRINQADARACFLMIGRPRDRWVVSFIKLLIGVRSECSVRCG